MGTAYSAAILSYKINRHSLSVFALVLGKDYPPRFPSAPPAESEQTTQFMVSMLFRSRPALF